MSRLAFFSKHTYRALMCLSAEAGIGAPFLSIPLTATALRHSARVTKRSMLNGGAIEGKDTKSLTLMIRIFKVINNNKFNVTKRKKAWFWPRTYQSWEINTIVANSVDWCSFYILNLLISFGFSHICVAGVLTFLLVCTRSTTKLLSSWACYSSALFGK